MRTETARKATNVSLPRHLVAEAKELGIALSRACERGLSEEIAEARARRWLEENGDGIAARNAHVEAEGLPLARFRSFCCGSVSSHFSPQSGLGTRQG